VHYVKVRLDQILGEDCFRNEIIWAYDYGGRPKDCWARKHDTVLWYSLDPSEWIFNLEASDRIPYMAPSLVGAEKAERGKHPTDVMWHTIAPTQGPERTGYPTQKPLGLLTRLVAVHSNPGDTILDLFAGSGTSGQAADNLGRNAVMVDINPEAIAVMQRRLLD
jgi:site-specific DNA-methyltransferase (adenine-specific)